MTYEETRLQNAVKLLGQDVRELQDEVEDLKGAIRMLAGNCACSMAERMSGHLVDCNTPHVLRLIDPEVDDE